MEISNRKRFRISVLFYLFLATVSVSAFAQEAKSQAILELDPDRYTDIILGVE